MRLFLKNYRLNFSYRRLYYICNSIEYVKLSSACIELDECFGTPFNTFNRPFDKLPSTDSNGKAVIARNEAILMRTLIAIVVRLLRRLKKPSRNDDASARYFR